ncbi:MAG: flippase-like domain-containing protein [Acidobacteria bacterium]|nr:flippase-like domain-containing protein [Acidobacteriota bacterium]
MKKTHVRLLIILLITLVFLFFAFKDVNWKDAVRYLSDVNLPIFILFLLFIPVHFITRALRWHYLLKHEKPRTSLYNRTAANAVGFTVSYIFPGRIGELVKPLYLARKENIRRGFAIGTVVIERVFDILTMCSLLGIFLLARPLYASIFTIDAETFGRLQLWGVIGAGIALGILVFALALIFFKDKTLKLVAFFLKPLPDKWTDKLMELADEFIHGLKFFHTAKDVLMYVLWSFIVWLSIIFLYFIFFYAYHIHINFFFLFPYIFLLLIGASIPTPGMVGGFHYFSILGLTTFYALNPDRAAGITIVCHLAQVVMTCLVGYAILWKEGISILQVKKMGESDKK